MWVLVWGVTALGVHPTHPLQAWDRAACWTEFFLLRHEEVALFDSKEQATPTPTTHFRVHIYVLRKHRWNAVSMLLSLLSGFPFLLTAGEVCVKFFPIDFGSAHRGKGVCPITTDTRKWTCSTTLAPVTNPSGCAVIKMFHQLIRNASVWLHLTFSILDLS